MDGNDVSFLVVRSKHPHCEKLWFKNHNVNHNSGWWYTYPSEKYEFVSWDYELPNIWKNKIHVPNQQPELHCGTANSFKMKLEVAVSS
jgi:hypothetical protein